MLKSIRKRELLMIYACDRCHFLFSRISMPDRCPDCGKEGIRLATREESEEFEARKKENLWRDRDTKKAP